MSGANDDREFDHVVEPWTVGGLRDALEGLHDDLPVTVWGRYEPGGELVAENVITNVAFGEVDRSDGAGPMTDRSRIGILVDWPTGRYTRPTT